MTDLSIYTFLAGLSECTRGAITLSHYVSSIGRDISKMLKFLFKVFYMVGKALTGKLSCMRTGIVFMSLCFAVQPEDLEMWPDYLNFVSQPS